MKLHVVRHAHAGDRRSWSGPDATRPLSKQGRRQAARIADRLTGAGLARLVSSPVRRCVQTLEPLGERLGVAVETDARLAEGARGVDALDLAEALRGDGGLDVAVVCTHGDVVPELLRSLRDAGARFDDPFVWPKASSWVVTADGHGWTTGAYVSPPDA